MISVRLDLVLMYEEDGFRRVYLHREVELPAVPRVGEQVNLTEGGWSEPVRAVWWVTEKTPCEVNVELGHRTEVHVNSGGFPRWRTEDPADELRELGWEGS